MVPVYFGVRHYKKKNENTKMLEHINNLDEIK